MTTVADTATDSIIEVLDRFTAALNAHDVEALAGLVTEDHVFENTEPAPDGTRIVGRDAYRAFLEEMLGSTPSARFTVEEQFGTPGGRAVVRWRYDWEDGHVRGVDILRIEGGRIAESLSYVKG